MKDEAWKQSTPREQLIAILSSITGQLSNIIDGTVVNREYVKTTAETCTRLIEELFQVTKFLPVTPWPDTPLENGVTFNRYCEYLGSRECNIILDDPAMDGIGLEHPAYDRGVEAGVRHAINVAWHALDSDDGKGVMSNLELEGLRRKLISLRTPHDTDECSICLEQQ